MKGVDEPDIINSYKQSATRFQLLEEPIDFARPFKVAIIGYGYSSICAAYKLSRRVKNAEIVMYDKNPDFGGTWLENKYPGVTCDVPSHSHQYSFMPNFYSGGADILKYLLHCADKLVVRRFAKLKHRINSAIWNEEEGRWELTICQIEDESTFADTADVVLTATGLLNNWKLPEIPGIADFKGSVDHTAEWTLEPADNDVWKTRHVAVIGSGSSATQVVPQLQPNAKHLDNYVRGRTWIAQPFALAFLQQYSDWETSNHVYSEEEKRTFREQPEIYKQMLMQLEDYNHSVHAALHLGTKMQSLLRNTYERKMKEMLAGRPDIADTLIPDFPFACRRITPGVGYLEALVSYISSPITRITENGYETADGNHRRCDVIVAATGFDTTYIPRFPVIGQQGENIQDKWHDHPVTYLGLCQDNFPNWFQISGPNSGVATGSLIMTIEAQCDYVAACIQKLQRQRIKYIVPKKQAVEDFQAYLDSYFPRTVWAQKCRTWYKAGCEDGKVTALWPGSSLHQYQALQQPRFEDFDCVYLYEGGDASKCNSLYWLGNGFTVVEQEGIPGTRGWRIGQDFMVDAPDGTWTQCQ